MTRFSAFAQDSDEDGSSSEESYQAPHTLSGAGPSTRRTLTPAPPAQQHEEPEGEDEGEDEYSDDGEKEEEEDESELSDTALDNTRLPDPSLIPRARQLGIDRQKMLVMQTSFFQAPEEEAVIQDLSRPEPSRKALLPPATIGRKHSRDSDGEGLRADSRQRPSFAHDVEPASFRPSRKYARVESSASAVTGHEGSVIDSGLSFGRSFRVGWGPGGTIAHVGGLSAPWSDTAPSANTSLVTVSTVPLVASAAEEAKDAAIKLLPIHLSNTLIEPDDDGVPQATPRPNLTFASLASLYPSNDKSFEALLFRLGHALFDPIDLHLPAEIDSSIRTRVETLRRKLELSNWLQDAVSPTVEAEVDDSLTDQQGWARAVFSLLTGNQIDRACEVALDSSNVKLATLISQVGGDADFRSDIHRQLDIWREQKVDIHIDENIRKIYALLAGIVDVLEGSKGNGLERCPDLSIGKGLDWKRAFGLHLWFGESLDAGIANSLSTYEGLVEEASPHATPPVPWYRERASSPKTAWKLPHEATSPDALFSLIKLFADPEHLLSQVLTPFSFSPSPSDYRLPWHLYILLSRSLRVRDFADRGDTGIDGERVDGAAADDDGDVENHSPSADLLANSYALQLEEVGLLPEAVFVLLHLEGSAGRKRAIQAMLARNAPKIDAWATPVLIGSLRIPSDWVNEAKAIYALAQGEVYEAYKLYLSAHMYTAAHDLVISELAPDAIIRKDLLLLETLLKEVSDHHVEGWHSRGKVLLDYVHVMTRIPELRDRLDTLTAPNAAEAAEIEEVSRTVPRLIQQLPGVLNGRGDIRHEAAVAEMIAGLTARLDQLRPLALGSQLRTARVPEATKLGHLRASAYEAFLQRIEVA